MDTIVVLKVGSEKEEIRIHKGLLCKASPYFRAALQGGFKEAQAQTIEWPEEDPKIVKLFQTWLYSRVIEFDAKPFDGSAWFISIDLYAFADRYHLPALKDSVIDILFTYLLENALKIPWAVFNRIYSVTSPKAPLRRLIVDLAVHRQTRSWVTDKPDDIEALFLQHLPKEYLVDVMLAAFDVKGAEEPGIDRLRGMRARYSHMDLPGESTE